MSIVYSFSAHQLHGTLPRRNQLRREFGIRERSLSNMRGTCEQCTHKRACRPLPGSQHVRWDEWEGVRDRHFFRSSVAGTRPAVNLFKT